MSKWISKLGPLGMALGLGYEISHLASQKSEDSGQEHKHEQPIIKPGSLGTDVTGCYIALAILVIIAVQFGQWQESSTSQQRVWDAQTTFKKRKSDNPKKKHWENQNEHVKTKENQINQVKKKAHFPKEKKRIPKSPKIIKPNDEDDEVKRRSQRRRRVTQPREAKCGRRRCKTNEPT